MRGDCWGTWLIILGFMDLGWPRVYRRSTSVLSQPVSNWVLHCQLLYLSSQSITMRCTFRMSNEGGGILGDLHDAVWVAWGCYRGCPDCTIAHGSGWVALSILRDKHSSGGSRVWPGGFVAGSRARWAVTATSSFEYFLYGFSGIGIPVIKIRHSSNLFTSYGNSYTGKSIFIWKWSPGDNFESVQHYFYLCQIFCLMVGVSLKLNTIDGILSNP